jgi:anti-sigma28 factor (negative regulator of flagellin synthesis)
MKIGQGSLDNNIGQTLGAGQTAGVGRGYGQNGVNRSQFGLDRADVSDVAQTASRVLGESSAQRSQQVANLAQQYQSGQYSVDPSTLSSAIINNDSAIDPIQSSH